MESTTKFSKQSFKTLEPLISDLWKEKAQNATLLSKQVGNIYTGSLYLNLASYLANLQDFEPKRVLMFSYGSGSLSSMFTLRLSNHRHICQQTAASVSEMMSTRIEVDPAVYSKIMINREDHYIHFPVRPLKRPKLLRPGTIVLSGVDKQGRRAYERATTSGDSSEMDTGVEKETVISTGRLMMLHNAMVSLKDRSKFGKKIFRNSTKTITTNKTSRLYNQFYKKSLKERVKIVSKTCEARHI